MLEELRLPSIRVITRLLVPSELLTLPPSLAPRGDLFFLNRLTTLTLLVVKGDCESIVNKPCEDDI